MCGVLPMLLLLLCAAVLGLARLDAGDASAQQQQYSVAAAPQHTQSLDGGGWRLSNANGSIPASVPGDAHAALQAAGIIDDIYFRFNSQKYFWIATENWTWSRNLTVPERGASGEQLAWSLVCDGLIVPSSQSKSTTPKRAAVSAPVRKHLAIFLWKTPFAKTGSGQTHNSIDERSTFFPTATKVGLRSVYVYVRWEVVLLPEQLNEL